MNPRSWFKLSLCLNLLLGALVAWAVKIHERPPAGPAVLASITNRIVRVQSITNIITPAAIAVEAPFDWHEVESTDYRVYIANLRGIGCPEATIRDIIVADVRDLFRRRMLSLVGEVSPYYWDLMADHDRLESLASKKQEDLSAMEEERAEMLQALFGDKDLVVQSRDQERAAESYDDFRQAHDFLPDDKVAEIKAIQDRSSVAREELARMGKLTKQERADKQKEIRAEEERGIRALLTPEEFDEYNLRTSAGNIRHDLGDFDTTEEELRAIAHVRMNTNGADRVRELLGPERFAEYQRASDNAYQQTLWIADRFDLPAETAVAVYRMQKEAEAEQRKIRSDRDRSPEERKAILQAMQAETEESISAVLGQRVFKAYRKHQGEWLSRFADEVK